MHSTLKATPNRLLSSLYLCPSYVGSNISAVESEPNGFNFQIFCPLLLSMYLKFEVKIIRLILSSKEAMPVAKYLVT
jgi:hypothetical protein